MKKAVTTKAIIVQAVPNPFEQRGFVLQIRSGKWANRGFLSDGHSSHGIWETESSAKTFATKLGYQLL